MTTEGPLLVLAGAGTGKTRVVTERIAYLLATHRSLRPENILAVTFTNKAAAEMRQRAGGLIGKKRAEELTLGTFHRFCLLALREHAERVGLVPGFSIADAADQLTAIKGAMRELRTAEATIRPAAVQSQISLAKNHLLDPETMLARASDPREELVASIWAKYDDHLRRTRSVDFDDLLVKTVHLLRDNDDLRTAYRSKHLYVMVDEYQDTNAPQYEIVRAIAAGHTNLCVVGDDDQSIYGWRGADVTKILSFEDDFPGATTVRLQTNYRSTEPILEAANRVIRHNSARHEKTLRSALGPGQQPLVLRHEDEVAEADAIVKEIATRRESHGLSLGDVAILFRTAIQTRAFEGALRAAQLPYILVGGPSFFDRKEVRDVLAYVRLLANPLDEVSLLRVVNTPARGIGKTSVDALIANATDRGINAWDAIPDAARIPRITATAASALAEFRALIELSRAGDLDGDIVGRIRGVIDRCQYRVEIDRIYEDPAQRELRWAAVMEVLNFAENYESRARRPKLSDFLDALTLNANNDNTSEDKNERQAVTLMTLHAAKGLEFDRVYLIGLEEGLMPHQRAVDEDTVEEERRLMYVGITRAQRSLTITWAGSRAKFGTRIASMPSRFLFEMSEQEPPPQWRPAAPRLEDAATGKKKTKRKRRTRAAR